MNIRKNGQQELVGFVLIVVLVMVMMMVFLVISVRDNGKQSSSVEVSNMLDVLFRTTTNCAISHEPDYDTIEDLFKSCYKGKTCSNLETPACDYLENELNDVVASMASSDALIGSWEIDFFTKDGDGLLRLRDGNCTSGRGAQRSLVSGGTSLIVRMRICED